MELVPSTVWESNIRNLVGPKEWDIIRKEQYKKANYRCEICKVESRLHCHEKWSYDDENHIQKLVGFVALCENCHMIKHAGFSMYTIEGRKKFDRNKLIEHFCRVNGCSREDFLSHEEKVFDEWKEKSNFEWKQDFGFWNNFIIKK